jgi:hypothetical protein
MRLGNAICAAGGVANNLIVRFASRNWLRKRLLIYRHEFHELLLCRILRVYVKVNSIYLVDLATCHSTESSFATRGDRYNPNQLIEGIVPFIPVRAHSSLSHCLRVFTLITNEALPQGRLLKKPTSFLSKTGIFLDRMLWPEMPYLTRRVSAPSRHENARREPIRKAHAGTPRKGASYH